jgi:hypothetical protein
MNLLYVRHLVKTRRRTARKKGKYAIAMLATLPLFCIQYADIYHRKPARIKQKRTLFKAFRVLERREKGW